MLSVSRKNFSYYDMSDHEKYGVHLASEDNQDPLGLSFHIIGDTTVKTVQSGFWAKLFGKGSTTKETFRPLVAGKEIPTDAQIIKTFERLRGAYEEVKEFKESEARILGTYPPNTVKAIEQGRGNA